VNIHNSFRQLIFLLIATDLITPHLYMILQAGELTSVMFNRLLLNQNLLLILNNTLNSFLVGTVWVDCFVSVWGFSWCSVQSFKLV